MLGNGSTFVDDDSDLRPQSQ